MWAGVNIFSNKGKKAEMMVLCHAYPVTTLWSCLWETETSFKSRVPAPWNQTLLPSATAGSIGVEPHLEAPGGAILRPDSL